MGSFVQCIVEADRYARVHGLGMCLLFLLYVPMHDDTYALQFSEATQNPLLTRQIYTHTVPTRHSFKFR